MCAVVVRPYARAADALTPWKPALIVEASRQFGCFVWADPQVRFAPLAGGDGGGLMAALRAELGVRGVLALRSPGSLAEHCRRTRCAAPASSRPRRCGTRGWSTARCSA